MLRQAGRPFVLSSPHPSKEGCFRRPVPVLSGCRIDHDITTNEKCFKVRPHGLYRGNLLFISKTPSMKTSNTTQTSRRNAHRSIGLRSHWFGPLLVCATVFVVLLLASYGVHAQTPVLKFTFEDAPGTTTANVASTPVVLTNFDKTPTLTPTDLHGLPSSGVSGQLDNNRALVLTNASYVASGGVYGPGAYVANSSTLANGLGNTITAFTATEWFKGTALPPVNANPKPSMV